MGMTKLQGAKLRLERAEGQRDMWVRHLMKYQNQQVGPSTLAHWQSEIETVNKNIELILQEIIDLTPPKEIIIPSVGIWDGSHLPV